MDKIQVISRSAITPIQTVQEGGELRQLGELRDFRWNDQLRSFMPAEGRFSVSWVRLAPGETLAPHVHPIPSMMVFYAGSGRMLGDLDRPIEKDDVVVVPAGCSHGFVGGPEGLHGLSIQFGDGLYTAPEKPRVQFLRGENTLSGLLEYNEQRRQEFARSSMFALLTDGTLDDAGKRAVFLDSLQVWLDTARALPRSRRPGRAGTTHRAESASRGRPGGDARPDPVMDAATSWFTYQTYLLDDAEKAAVLLVSENAVATYAARAQSVLGKHIDVHSLLLVADAGNHETSGEGSLRNESPKAYVRLRQIVGEAWDMIGTVSNRVVELTRAAPTASPADASIGPG